MGILWEPHSIRDGSRGVSLTKFVISVQSVFFAMLFSFFGFGKNNNGDDDDDDDDNDGDLGSRRFPCRSGARKSLSSLFSSPPAIIMFIIAEENTGI